MRFFIQQKQNGFSLIELVTVLLIITVLSTVAIRSTVDIGYAARYEQTKDRFDSIKKAIIGNPDKFINGIPDIDSFVSDVGRLPFALQELLDGNHCPDTQYFNQTDCDGALTPGAWIATPNWNGPYLDVSSNADDLDAYTDGWGKTGAGNYGWSISFFDNLSVATTTLANVKSMVIQSGGKNQIINSTDTGFDQDYPENTSSATISSDDWQVLYSSFAVNLTPPINFSECNITSIPIQNACEAAQGAWKVAHCRETSKTTSGACVGGSLAWDSTYSVCVDTSITTSASCTPSPLAWMTGPCNPLNTSGLCSVSWMRWDTGLSNCFSKSKSFCDDYYGASSFSDQSIDLLIDGSVASTVLINLNGSEQTIDFSAVPVQTIGLRKILISKSGTNHIFPPSCLGLNGDTDSNSIDDCTDAGGTLLDSGICDDITISDCLAGAGNTGNVTRNVMSIPFTPNKSAIQINW